MIHTKTEQRAVAEHILRSPQLSLLDRAAYVLSPRWAFERQSWRAALHELRSYDAGRHDRHNADWGPSWNLSAEMTDKAYRDTVRARARELERNSDLMSSVVLPFVRHVVGRGLTLQANLVNASDDELQKLDKVFQHGTKVATEAMQSEFSGYLSSEPGKALVDSISASIQETGSLDAALQSLAEKAKQGLDNAVASMDAPGSGANISAGVGQGIQDNLELVTDAVNQMVDTADETFATAAESNSPAQRFVPHGENITLGVAEGVTGKIDDLSHAMIDLVDVAYDSAEDETQAVGFFTIGDAMIEGMIDGIQSGIPSLISAAREAARADYEAARAELDINSPSKRFRYLGQMSVEGYEGAIVDGKSSWQSALRNSIDGTLSAFDASRHSVAAGNAASIVNNNSYHSSETAGEVIFQKGAIVIQTSDTTTEAGARRIARAIGEEASKKKRWKGGV